MTSIDVYLAAFVYFNFNLMMGYVASFCLCAVLTYRLLHESFLITTVELREIHCLYKYCFTERNNRGGFKLRRFVSLSIK